LRKLFYDGAFATIDQLIENNKYVPI